MLSTCGTWDSSFAGRGYAGSFNHQDKNAHELELIVQQVQRLSSFGKIAEALK